MFNLKILNKNQTARIVPFVMDVQFAGSKQCSAH